MYKIKRINGSFPKSFNTQYENYSEARAAVRRYMRNHFQGSVGKFGTPSLTDASAIGIFINKSE